MNISAPRKRRWATLTAMGVCVAGVMTVTAPVADAQPSAASAAPVQAWGSNVWGQLGNPKAGSIQPKPGPMAISARVKAVAAGFAHSLILDSDGKVWATGDNRYGQLGNGTNESRFAPMHVPGLPRVDAIAAGANHSLALAGGRVFAWGFNMRGQLGDGTKTNRNKPVRGMVPAATVTAIAAGANHSLRLLADGTVEAYGDNSDGALGIGNTEDQNRPVPVKLASVAGIAGGASHSLLLLKDGSVWATGRNNSGQLGIGSHENHNTPVHVLGPHTKALAVAAGSSHSIVLLADRTVLAFGSNRGGQLGDGTSTPERNTPVKVANLEQVTSISAGGGHSLAVKIALA